MHCRQLKPYGNFYKFQKTLKITQLLHSLYGFSVQNWQKNNSSPLKLIAVIGNIFVAMLLKNQIYSKTEY